MKNLRILSGFLKYIFEIVNFLKVFQFHYDELIEYLFNTLHQKVRISQPSNQIFYIHFVNLIIFSFITNQLYVPSRNNLEVKSSSNLRFDSEPNIEAFSSKINEFEDSLPSRTRVKITFQHVDTSLAYVSKYYY